MRPRDHDLRAPVALLDLDHIGLHPIVLPVAFPGNLLGRRQHRLDATEIHVDVSPLHPLDRAGNDVPFPIAKLLVHHVPLGLADPLHDDLLRRLGGDPAEVLGGHLDLDDVADLAFRVPPSGLRQRDLRARIRHLLDDRPDAVHVLLAGLPVQFDPDVLGG